MGAPVNHKRIKPKPAKHPKHLARVRKMPCLTCGSRSTEAHHVIGYADRMGRAPKTDRRVVPLCSFCHRDSLRAVHAIGHMRFCEDNNIDLMAEAVRIADESIMEGIL